MKRLWAPVAALLCSVAVVSAASGFVRVEWAENVLAQINNIPPPRANCAPLGNVHLNGQRVPTSIEPEFSIWCYNQPPAIPPTRSSGANDWVDTFDNNAPSIVHFDDHDMGYRVFDTFNGPTSGFSTGYFVNVNHWMIDLADISPFRLSGGILVSPDKQFQFENGKIVVEVDAAAGSDGMGGANRFYEIDLTPAAEPTGITTDSLYGYGAFGRAGAIGCRLERNDQGGNLVCAMYDNSGRVTGGECPPDGRVCLDNGGRPGRVWETQGPGTHLVSDSIQGGYAQWPIPGTALHVRDVWRTCADNELDLHCRDRFRLEVTKTSIHMFVNGFPVMLIDDLFPVNPNGADSRIPDSWFASGVRPYFSSWINGGQHTPTRWHWDRVAVNPHDAAGNPLPPSASPSFCLGLPNNTCPDPGLGATDVPTSTPVAGATATPSPSRTPTGVPTSTPRATATATPTSASSNNPHPTATPMPTDAPPATPTDVAPGVDTPTPVPTTPPPPPPSSNNNSSSSSSHSSSSSSSSSTVLSGEGGSSGGGGFLVFAPPPNAPAPAPQSAGPAPASPGFRADLSADGGQLVANNVILAVPSVALQGEVASLSAAPLITDPAWQQLEGGFTLADTVYQVRLVRTATGEDLTPGAPLTLVYQPTAAEVTLTGGQLGRIHPAVWSGTAWLALSCGQDSVALTCALPHVGLLGVVVAPGVSDVLDSDLPSGHFYKQANGYAGAGDSGFAVVDDADAAFWSEFQRLGGVAQLGYPISGRFQFRGFLTQVFQKMALQWRPELGAAVPVNTLDELSQPGQASWLESNRQVPRGPTGLDDAGLPWDEVVARHEALLDAYPALREYYDNDADPLEHFGLPLSVADYGPMVSVRLQRATLQLWTVDVPWAAAGTVVMGNSGDLAKEVGLWSAEALVPRPAGAYAQISEGSN